MDTPRMNKIKLLVSAGIDFPAAAKAAMGMSVREFAETYGVPETAVSGVINGSTPHPQERVRNALAEHFMVERMWLDEQLDATQQKSAA